MAGDIETFVLGGNGLDCVERTWKQLEPPIEHTKLVPQPRPSDLVRVCGRALPYWVFWI